MVAGLKPVAPAAVPDLVLHLGARAPWADSGPAADGLIYRAPSDAADPPMVEATWASGRQGILLRYADGTEFHVSEDAREAWASWPAPLTVADAMVYLLGPVLGYVLRRRGVLALHASGVVIEGRAAAFCGGSGAGKSTIAAAVATAGHVALADDVLALREVDGRTMAYPAHDHLRVWDDTAALFVDPAEPLELLTPNWDKRALPLERLGTAIARAPAPLGAIFVLGERTADEAAPRTERVRAADALLQIITNTAANYLLSREMRGEELALLARVLDRTPVYRLTPSSDPARLPLLVSRVAETLREGRGGSGA